MENNPLHDDNFYLGHIQEAINSIKEYLGDIDYDSFCKNGMIIDAVVRKIEIVGEASNNLSADFKKSHPQIPLWLHHSSLSPLRFKPARLYFLSSSQCSSQPSD